MPATTGDAIVSAAFRMLNVLVAGQAIPGNLGDDALDHLNRMLSQWRTRKLFIPIVAREPFDMTAGKGSTTNPYTIGTAGDLVTTRPATWKGIPAANLVLTTASPTVRVPLTIMTEQAYYGLTMPDQTGEQPTALFYNPTYATDLGSVHLWPVPTIATNDLELFIEKPIAKFDDLSTTYYLPDGADDAIVYNLMRRMAGPYGRKVDPEDKQLAIESLAALKRSNVRLEDVVNDAAWATGQGGFYDINIGA